MKYVAACMLVQLSGKPPSKENVTAVLESIGADIDDELLTACLKKLQGQSFQVPALTWHL